MGDVDLLAPYGGGGELFDCRRLGHIVAYDCDVPELYTCYPIEAEAAEAAAWSAEAAKGEAEAWAEAAADPGGEGAAEAEEAAAASCEPRYAGVPVHVPDADLPMFMFWCVVKCRSMCGRSDGHSGVRAGVRVSTD